MSLFVIRAATMTDRYRAEVLATHAITPMAPTATSTSRRANITMTKCGGRHGMATSSPSYTTSFTWTHAEERTPEGVPTSICSALNNRSFDQAFARQLHRDTLDTMLTTMAVHLVRESTDRAITPGFPLSLLSSGETIRWDFVPYTRWYDADACLGACEYVCTLSLDIKRCAPRTTDPAFPPTHSIEVPLARGRTVRQCLLADTRMNPMTLCNPIYNCTLQDSQRRTHAISVDMKVEVFVGHVNHLTNGNMAGAIFEIHKLGALPNHLYRPHKWHKSLTTPSFISRTRGTIRDSLSSSSSSSSFGSFTPPSIPALMKRFKSSSSLPTPPSPPPKDLECTETFDTRFVLQCSACSTTLDEAAAYYHALIPCGHTICADCAKSAPTECGNCSLSIDEIHNMYL